MNLNEARQRKCWTDLTNLAFTAKHKTNIATGNLDGLWVRYNPNKFLQSSVLTLASNY